MEPGLAGTDARARYVLALEGPAPDLARWQEAQARDPAEAARLGDSMRQQLASRHAPVETAVSAVQGRVVAWWWMSNEATIEVPAAGVASVQVAQGVSSVRPDRQLQ
jgi:hypothetical protein